MNVTTSPKAIPLSFLCSSEKYPPRCLLDPVLYKLLTHALWYTASWAIMSPFWSFACKKEPNKFAHLLHVLSDQARKTVPWMMCLFQWLMIHYKEKHVDLLFLEDFDIWCETIKKPRKSTFRIVLLTETFYINRKFRNFKKFPCIHFKMADTAIL